MENLGKIIKKLFILIFRILPLRRAVIFESHPDFSDNSLALYQEFLRRGMLKRYRLYWMKTFRGGEVPELPEGVSVFENEPGGLKETIRRTYVQIGRASCRDRVLGTVTAIPLSTSGEKGRFVFI